MRVLVTGADGFVAGHLIPFLREAGHDVVGTALAPHHPASGGTGTGLDPARAAVDVPVRRLDVTDAAACAALVSDVAPTHIVHLAAVSSVRWSFDHPDETHRVNVEGTRHVLEAAAELRKPPRTLVVGSGEEYGRNNGNPLSELPLAELRPLSPYAESKVAAERLIEETPAFRAVAIRTRSFPHFGPGQSLGFFTADVASALVRIERAGRGAGRGASPPVLRVGNVDVVRDYTDVRDVVRAYAPLLERGVPGEVYNVCSGRGAPMRELLSELIRLSGVQAHVEQDPEKLRPSEIPVLIGESAKLRAATGWEPHIPLKQSLRDVLVFWRASPPLAARERVVP